MLRVCGKRPPGFRISLVRETETGEEVLDLDRLATDSEMSPIIKLVDDYLQRMESRASDIHIETRDTEVQVQYRIDGALRQVDPIDLAYHQTLISRIRLCPSWILPNAGFRRMAASACVIKDAT